MSTPNPPGRWGPAAAQPPDPRPPAQQAPAQQAAAQQAGETVRIPPAAPSQRRAAATSTPVATGIGDTGLAETSLGDTDTEAAGTAGTVALPGALQQPLARPPVAGTPVPNPPASPPGGTVWRSENSQRSARRHALSHQLHRLRIGWHLVSPDTLRQLRTAAAGTGLILGLDQQRAPVTIRFFRPEPTRVTLVGGVWAQRLIAFRALSLGARVIVMTSHPAAWHGFGEWATGRADRVTLWTDPRSPVVPATAEEPVLVIHELEAYGLATMPERAPWQTQLVAVHRLGPDNAHTLTDCDLLIMQRLTAAEAGVAVPALGLPSQSGELLQAMTDDMLALLGGGADRYTWLTPTGTELQYHGAPRR